MQLASFSRLVSRSGTTWTAVYSRHTGRLVFDMQKHFYIKTELYLGVYCFVRRRTIDNAPLQKVLRFPIAAQSFGENRAKTWADLRWITSRWRIHFSWWIFCKKLTAKSFEAWDGEAWKFNDARRNQSRSLTTMKDSMDGEEFIQLRNISGDR